MSGVSRRVRAVALVTLAVVAVSCGDDPPQKEMHEAQSAIEAARAAGAAEYARDELAAADDALKRAHDAVAERDYRLALNNAIESRERAQNAAKESADQKASERTDAERALRDASAELAQAKTKLKAAEGAHLPARLLNEARESIDGGEEAVQEARAAAARGDYRDVTRSLSGPIARLAGAVRDLDAAGGAGLRRRR